MGLHEAGGWPGGTALPVYKWEPAKVRANQPAQGQESEK